MTGIVCSILKDFLATEYFRRIPSFFTFPLSLESLKSTLQKCCVKDFIKMGFRSCVAFTSPHAHPRNTEWSIVEKGAKLGGVDSWNILFTLWRYAQKGWCNRVKIFLLGNASYGPAWMCSNFTSWVRWIRALLEVKWRSSSHRERTRWFGRWRYVLRSGK